MRNVLLATCMLAATASAASGTNEVTLCTAGSRPGYVPYAQKATVALFRNIRVPLTWADASQCPAGAITIRFERGEPATEHPGALAYAHPYQAKTIVVFPDRIEHISDDRLFLPKLLAHVLAHEITHVLQGTARHSETGIMKSSWTSRDYSEMAWNGMSFAAVDVTLIERGLRRSFGCLQPRVGVSATFPCESRDQVLAMIDPGKDQTPTRSAHAQSFPILQGSEDAIQAEIALAAHSAYTSADPA